MLTLVDLDHSIIPTPSRIIEIHSPDRRQNCIIRCLDSNQASLWLRAINAVTNELNSRALRDTNEAIGKAKLGVVTLPLLSERSLAIAHPSSSVN